MDEPLIPLPTQDASKPRLGFYCPGCKTMHVVRVGPGGWGWNGSYANPTLTPSVLVTSGHHVPNHEAGSPCWCSMPDSAFKCERCHSYVTDGVIEFLPDCSHELAGQKRALRAPPENPW